MASRTCEGSIAPEEHAAPLETASPFRSRAITSASLPLMAATINLRLDQRSLLDVKGSGSLRRMDLVSGNRKRVAGNLIHVDRRLARSLHCISMKKDVSFSRDFANFFHRLNHSG